jgi:NDP-sugar pyrophosphorylase family protein
VRLGRNVEVRDLSVLGEGVVVGDSNELKQGIRVWPGREIPADSLHF